MEAPKCRLCQNRHWGQCGPDETLVFKSPLQRALESPQAGPIIEHEAESPLTPAFDRSAYQRAYMREYMRKRREVKT